jgi:hypothetical protein
VHGRRRLRRALVVSAARAASSRPAPRAATLECATGFCAEALLPPRARAPACRALSSAPARAARFRGRLDPTGTCRDMAPRLRDDRRLRRGRLPALRGGHGVCGASCPINGTTATLAHTCDGAGSAGREHAPVRTVRFAAARLLRRDLRLGRELRAAHLRTRDQPLRRQEAPGADLRHRRGVPLGQLLRRRCLLRQHELRTPGVQHQEQRGHVRRRSRRRRRSARPLVAAPRAGSRGRAAAGGMCRSPPRRRLRGRLLPGSTYRPPASAAAPGVRRRRRAAARSCGGSACPRRAANDGDCTSDPRASRVVLEPAPGRLAAPAPSV